MAQTPDTTGPLEGKGITFSDVLGGDIEAKPISLASALRLSLTRRGYSPTQLQELAQRSVGFTKLTEPLAIVGASNMSVQRRMTNPDEYSEINEKMAIGELALLKLVTQENTNEPDKVAATVNNFALGEGWEVNTPVALVLDTITDNQYWKDRINRSLVEGIGFQHEATDEAYMLATALTQRIQDPLTQAGAYCHMGKVLERLGKDINELRLLVQPLRTQIIQNTPTFPDTPQGAKAKSRFLGDLAIIEHFLLGKTPPEPEWREENF